MWEKIKTVIFMLLFSLLLFVVLSILAGCSSRPAIVTVDTGDLERMRSEYQYLREEYNRLEQDHTRLIAENEFYANYYRDTTTAVAAGIRELNELGNSNATEITKLRGCIAILRRIIDSVIAGQHGEGQPDIETDPD